MRPPRRRARGARGRRVVRAPRRAADHRPARRQPRARPDDAAALQRAVDARRRRRLRHRDDPARADAGRRARPSRTPPRRPSGSPPPSGSASPRSARCSRARSCHARSARSTRDLARPRRALPAGDGADRRHPRAGRPPRRHASGDGASATSSPSPPRSSPSGRRSRCWARSVDAVVATTLFGDGRRSPIVLELPVGRASRRHRSRHGARGRCHAVVGRWSASCVVATACGRRPVRGLWVDEAISVRPGPDAVRPDAHRHADDRRPPAASTTPCCG